MLRKVLNFPERSAARLVREYRQTDLETLKRWHAAQGFDYPFPDLDDPNFAIKVVLEDENGRPAMAALGRLTCEAFLLMNPGGDPLKKWRRLAILEREALATAKERGLSDAQCWLPPNLPRRFRDRLESLGWTRDDVWTPYQKRF